MDAGILSGIDTDESMRLGRISTPMVAALEQAWAQIRDWHPDVPPVVVVLGARSIGTAGLRLGHFAAMRWHHEHAGEQGDEVGRLAEELGIEVHQDPRIGWSLSTLPNSTRTAHATTIDALGAALRLYRAAEVTGSGSGKSTSPPPCVCGCGRRIRVAPSVLAAGPISCAVCGTDFAPEDQP